MEPNSPQQTTPEKARRRNRWSCAWGYKPVPGQVKLYVPQHIFEHYQGHQYFHHFMTLAAILVLRHFSREPDYKGFFRIKYARMMRIIGNNLCPFTHQMVADGFLEIDHSYKVGSYAKGYRLTKHSKIVAIVIGNPGLWKRLGQGKKAKREALHNHIKENLKKVDIDLESFDTQQLIDLGLDEQLIDYYRMMVDAIKTGSLWFATDHDTGRVFNNITNLKRELRSKLTYEGEELAEIDVKNSQPFLAAASIPDRCDRRAAVKLIQDTDIYSDIAEIAGCTRAEAKEIAFKVIFFGPERVRHEVWQWFRVKHKKLAKFVSQMKQEGEYAKDKRRPWSSLPVFLQKREADIMIRGVCQKLMERGIFFLPVHDSILCRPQDSNEVARLIQEEFKRETGHTPALHIKDSSGERPFEEYATHFDLY